MISFDELERRTEAEFKSKPQTFIGSIVVGIIAKLVVEYIYDRCVKNKKMTVRRIEKRGIIDRMILKRIIKDKSGDPLVKQAWDADEVLGKAGEGWEFNKESTYINHGDKVYDIVVNVGKTLKQEDLE